MMLKMISASCFGFTIGAIATFLLLSSRSGENVTTNINSEDFNNLEVELEKLNKQISMQQFENELLVKMVKSGLSGNIKKHVNTFQKLDDIATSHLKESVIADTKQIKTVDPASLISQIHKADVALQKQALSEGWAYDETFQHERKNLWLTAKKTLTEQEYMKGLYASDLPNVLYVESVRTPFNQQIKKGDILTHIAQERIFNRDDLRYKLQDFKQFEPLEITFNRNGNSYKAEVSNINKNIDFIGASIQTIQQIN